MKKAAELVIIPAPGIGHIVSAVEMAKLLVARDDQLFITVLIMKLDLDSKPKGIDITYTGSDRINFITLPEVNISTEGMSPNNFLKLFVESHKPHIKDTVSKLSQSQSEARLAGFVIDMFCTSMIDVANELGVPTYVFFASNAGFLALLFHLQILHDEHNKDCTDLKDSDAELVLPSFTNPLPASALPSMFLDKDSTTTFINHARRFRETKGILVNTFMELEANALHSLSDGKTPPVYPIGPMLNITRNEKHEDSDLASDSTLKWLDEQPPLSVVFLCFGSMGSFDEDQVKEIAYALEHSGLRFLWSLRQPPAKGKVAYPSDYADYRGVFPEGFLDRTTGIGKVIGWAPQVAILAHPAIGGFVSHCGWNSMLESLWCGVPVGTLPMYAEQHLNAFEMVRELGLAVEVSMAYKKGSVNAEDIERGIRQVMEHDSDIRKRVKEMSKLSKTALMDGGSSYSSLGRFIEQIFL
ncbi:putative UDP-glucose flavonoid 3-O-glucosyltransferase 3 [Rosa rugosa]|uniref:putative UDP-glucose flavonoid 3-O-glucosyltransferase 3 n=1 Tax=Rosa rugosa TaxID=74645 RepID=UPI002B40F1CF|nr:putative UDP-glucose flavonoid 3-O-glucosyltransferase 3 [Rosa rugosa]